MQGELRLFRTGGAEGGFTQRDAIRADGAAKSTQDVRRDFAIAGAMKHSFLGIAVRHLSGK